MVRLHRTLLLGALLTASACAAGTPSAFTPNFPDNSPRTMQALMQQVARVTTAEARKPPPLAVGVNAHQHVYGYDLTTERVRWQTRIKPRFTPLLAGDVAVIQQGDSILGLDLNTGEQRFEFDAGELLLAGADGAGDGTLIALTASASSPQAKSRLLFLRDGRLAWEHELNDAVGVPALSGSVALVPWSTHYLSGLSIDTGAELARLHFHDAVVSQAFVSGDQVYVGGTRGIALLSPALTTGRWESAPHFAPALQEVPGRPAFLADAYQSPPLPAPDGAQIRVRSAWLPTLSQDRLGLADNTLYSVFYRLVFAFDAQSGALRFVHTHDSDVIGARAEAGGLVIADTQGELSFLDSREGARAWQTHAAPQSLQLTIPATQKTGAEPEASRALRLQLAQAAADPDARLVPAQLLTVKTLVDVEDPAATVDLLTLCESDRTTPGVRQAACDGLGRRKPGDAWVQRALSRHASYLSASSTPPVAALAKAAAAQKNRAAVPLLIEHLQDPNTPTSALPDVVDALAALDDARAAHALQQFYLLYHADPVDPSLSNALARVPVALLRLSHSDARGVLKQVAEDPLAPPSVRTSAAQMLVQTMETEHEGKLASKPATETQADAAKPAEPEAPPAPEHITDDIVRQALLPVHDKLRACLQDARPSARQARVVFSVETGRVSMATVVPAELQPCIEPLVRAQQFPVTERDQAEQVTYLLQR